MWMVTCIGCYLPPFGIPARRMPSRIRSFLRRYTGLTALIGIRQRSSVNRLAVMPGSRAATLGAKPGDLITHADDRPVKSIAALTAHLKRRGVDGMRLTFLRGKDSRTVEVLLTAASF